MTDKQWLRKIQKAVRFQNLFEKARKEAETEYEKRYGHHPSDIDDDWWIDAVLYGGGESDIDKIKEQAELSVKLFEANN